MNNQVNKGQLMRLLDVFVIGPFMIYAGAQIKDPYVKTGLIGIGIGTIVQNGKNYLVNEGILDVSKLPFIDGQVVAES